ncbi:dual specificity protein phosphatase family protein [Candidatus Sumerlaeota bacterium]|nr:dual specificity protein phosphatase family protein [Candidatus Sumerlaeota bacterium]
MSSHRGFERGVVATLSLLLTLALPLHADLPRPRPLIWAQPMIGSSLENFHCVNDHLYRSAQPDSEALAEVAALGIQVVLNLRSGHDDEDEAEGLDLRLFRVPAEADEITVEQIEEALAVIQLTRGPTLVHCWHGSDRTGVVMAAYRMVVQDWSLDEAWDEMVNGGFGFHEEYMEHMREVLLDLDVEGIRQRLGVSLD